MTNHSTDPIHFANPEELIACYEVGVSVKQLSDDLGLSRPLITRFLKRNGVKLRGSTEVNRRMAKERSPEERQRNARAAHDAVRGKKQSPEYLVKRALMKEQTCFSQSHYERELLGAIQASGLAVRPQAACGKYNVDILVDEGLAVEIMGGGWHLNKRHQARNRTLFDCGFDRLDIWPTSNHHINPNACIDRIQEMLSFRKSNPNGVRRYDMIYADGKPRTFRDPSRINVFIPEGINLLLR